MSLQDSIIETLSESIEKIARIRHNVGEFKRNVGKVVIFLQSFEYGDVKDTPAYEASRLRRVGLCGVTVSRRTRGWEVAGSTPTRASCSHGTHWRQSLQWTNGDKLATKSSFDFVADLSPVCRKSTVAGSVDRVAVDIVANVAHVQLRRLCRKWVISVARMSNVLWLCRQCVPRLITTAWAWTWSEI